MIVQVRSRGDGCHLAVHPVELADVLTHLVVHHLDLLHVQHVLHCLHALLHLFKASLVHLFEASLVALHDLVELVLLGPVLGGRAWLELRCLSLLLGLLAWHQHAALRGVRLLATVIIALLFLAVGSFAAFTAGCLQGLATSLHCFSVVQKEFEHHSDGAELLADFDGRDGSASTLLRMKQISEQLVQYFDLLRLVVHH